MSSLSSVTSREFGRRFRKAVSVQFLLDQLCSSSIQQFVSSYASSLGCNEKCVLFPLLTCCGACMGASSYIELTADWHELPIIWTSVITPMTLHRIDVAEHLKSQLLNVQNELCAACEADDDDDSDTTHSHFIIDSVNSDILQETLKNNDGHAVGIYDSARSLCDVMSMPRDAEIMMKLHSGSSWFSNNNKAKKILSKTCVNFAIVSTPDSVHQMLQSSSNFPEFFHNCFLTVCAEEIHVKFGQLSSPSQSETLRRIFKELIKLHSGNSIVYKLSSEATEKFGQIHDEITDKAKQLARKNSNRIFHPALSYLGRLSVVLHALDNIIDAVNWNIPLDPLTWNTEISADTVWHARQILSYIIEEKCVLSEPTTTLETPSTPSVPSVDLVDPSDADGTPVRTNLFGTRHSSSSAQKSNNSPSVALRNQSRTFHTPSRNSLNHNGTQENVVVNNSNHSASDNAFDLLLASSSTNNNSKTNNDTEPRASNPQIVSVRSAGVPVPIENVTCDVLPTDLSFPPSVSMSVVPESGNSDSLSQPAPLLSRPLHSSNASSASPNSSSSAFSIPDNDFFQNYRVQIRRLLTYGMSEISVSRCVELRLAPDLVGSHNSRDETKKQKYSALARGFLKKLESLGFGLCDVSSTNSKHFTFKKIPYNTLNKKQKTMLTNVRIFERDYDRCFNKTSNNTQSTVKNSSSNDVVCLE